MIKYYLTILNILIILHSGSSQNIVNGNNEIDRAKSMIYNKLIDSGIDDYNSPQSFAKYVQDDYGTPPQWEWISLFGGSGKDIGRAVVVSADGSFFITGSFSGEISIGSNSYISIGKRDAFLAKFQNDGSFVWFKQFSPLPYEKIDSYNIDLDEMGNIYFTGYYSGDVSFGNFNLPGNYEMNMFVAVTDSNGEVTLALNHSSANSMELGLKVETDASGNIYVLVSTNGSISFYHPSAIVIYDPSGNVVMDYYHEQAFCDLKIVNDNIYFIGRVNSPGYIGDFYLEPMGYGDAFVAKSNLNIVFEWVEMAGHEAYGDSYAISLFVSPEEDVYFSGSFRYDISWGDYTLVGDGGFVTSCSSDGEILWMERVCGYVSGNSLFITGNDENVFISCNYQNNKELKAYNAITGQMVWVNEPDLTIDALAYSSSDNSLVLLKDDNQELLITKIDETTQNDQWNIQVNGNSAWSHSIGMAVDQNGFQYNFGYASNQMDYLGETINKGLFLAKQNTEGTPSWVLQFTDADDVSNDVGSFVTVDTITNNVYVTGTFINPLVIPGGPTLIPSLFGSIFMLKYDFGGNFHWAVQEDFTSSTLCITSDNSGNVLLTGTFEGEIAIGNTNLVSAGSNDVFIAKYNINGDPLWAKRAGGETVEYWSLISTDGQDNIYMTGEFDSEQVTVDDYEIIMEEGDGNILIAKFDSMGNVQWVTVVGGSTISGSADYYGWPTGIYTDFEGYSYIKGWCNDSSNFDDIILTSLFTNPDINRRWNKFVAKFDPLGNTIWASSINEQYYSWDYNQFDVDRHGNIFSGLSIRGDTTLFGEDFEYIKKGKEDLLIVNYTDEGELNWVKSIEDSETGSTYISTVAAYSDDVIFVSGWFTDYLDFGSASFEVTNKTGFVGQMGELTSVTEYERDTESILFSLYPNPTADVVNISITDGTSDNTKIVITDITGRQVLVEQIDKQLSEIIIDISAFSPGVYNISLQAGNKTGVRKLIVN